MWRLFIVHREECYTILFPVIPQERVDIGPMHEYGFLPREMARRWFTNPSPIARAVWRNIYPRVYRYNEPFHTSRFQASADRPSLKSDARIRSLVNNVHVKA